MKKDIKYILLFIVLIGLYFWDVPLKGLLLAVGDGFTQSYPMVMEITRQYKDLTLPLWNPYSFSGFPLMATMQYGAFYPPAVLPSLLLNPPSAFNFIIMLHFVLAGFFTFLYAKEIGLRPIPSLMAGMVFSTLGYIPAHLLHLSIITSGAWLPLILYFFERLRQSPDIKNTACASIALGLQVLAGHPQLCFYTYILLAMFTIFHLIHIEPGKRLRFAGFGLAAFGLAMLIALPQLTATYELTRYGPRGNVPYEFFTQYSFPFHMIPALLFPFLYGGGYAGAYWGPDIYYVRMVEGFIGTLPIFLAAAAFWHGRKTNLHVKFWGLAAVIIFILALGDSIRPLHKLMFHVPIYSSFRGASKHWFELTFALGILAGFGMSFLFYGEKSERLRKTLLIIIFSVMALSLVSFTVSQDILSSIVGKLNPRNPGLIKHGLSLTYPGVYIPLIFMSLYLFILLAFNRLRWLRYGVFLVIFLEAMSFKTTFSPPPSAEVQDYQKELMLFLKSRDGRVSFMTRESPDSLPAMRYGISSINGYDPLFMQDYALLLRAGMAGVSLEWRALIENNLILSMLNAKSLVVDSSYGDLQEIMGGLQAQANKDRKGFLPPIGRGLPPSKDYAPIYRKVFEHEGVIVYENLNVLPRAYPVVRLRPMDSIDELRTYLYAFQIDPWQEASVSSEDFAAIGTNAFSPDGEVSIVDYKTDAVSLKTRFPAKGFIVLSDQYYPGWRAYVDGKETKIYKTNGVLRGIIVPDGEHTVIFKYRPVKIYLAMAMAGIALLSAVIIIVVGRKAPK